MISLNPCNRFRLSEDWCCGFLWFNENLMIPFDEIYELPILSNLHVLYGLICLTFLVNFIIHFRLKFAYGYFDQKLWLSYWKPLQEEKEMSFLEKNTKKRIERWSDTANRDAHKWERVLNQRVSKHSLLCLMTTASINSVLFCKSFAFVPLFVSPAIYSSGENLENCSQLSLWSQEREEVEGGREGSKCDEANLEWKEVAGGRSHVL